MSDSEDDWERADASRDAPKDGETETETDETDETDARRHRGWLVLVWASVAPTPPEKPERGERAFATLADGELLLRRERGGDVVARVDLAGAQVRLCHNDLHVNNIMAHAQKVSRVTLIDFEYACANYIGLDVCNSLANIPFILFLQVHARGGAHARCAEACHGGDRGGDAGEDIRYKI